MRLFRPTFDLGEMDVFTSLATTGRGSAALEGAG